MRITIVSIQTFGDYLLKAPFLHQMFSRYPGAEVTLVTNRKGAMVYPLVDSRLKLVVIDKQDSKLSILSKLIAIPKAEILYIVDISPVSYAIALVVRARKKIGWQQSISKLFQGPQIGFRDYYWVSPKLKFVMGLVLDKKRLREPEDAYEGHVELRLLDNPAIYPRLAQYRAESSFKPALKPAAPLILCCTGASWNARQLNEEVWNEILQTLLATYPNHEFVVDGPSALLAGLGGNPRIRQMQRSDQLEDFFSLVASADTVICSDSFPCHVASWFDVPAVVIFGPAPPHRFAPTAPGSTSLYHPPPCAPCYQQVGSKPCAAGFTQCLSLQQITSDEVCAAVKKAIDSRARLTGSRSPKLDQSTIPHFKL
jgi:ADP-heptose:LPS heptosyltransferase